MADDKETDSPQPPSKQPRLSTGADHDAGTCYFVVLLCSKFSLRRLGGVLDRFARFVQGR